MSKHIDRDRLLSFLADKSKHQNPLVHATLEGLRQRILRGEFDERTPPDPIAVANAEQSDYFREHPIQNDAGYGPENEEQENTDGW